MIRSYTAASIVTCILQACSTTEGPVSTRQTLTFEEFRAQAFRDPGTNGYIINGDELVANDTELRAAYEDYLRSADDAAHPEESKVRQGLAINRIGGRDDRWDIDTANNITYCVSRSSFGDRYDTIVRAIHDAAANWHAAANVLFTHVAELDTNCTNTSGVLFNVRQVAQSELGDTIVANAPFPSQSRALHELRVTPLAFNNLLPRTLTGWMRHELGHVLGFRHEQTRPEAGACFEDNNWRGLTVYDAASVMHYPQCNGTQRGDLVLTPRDILGARTVYPRISGDDIIWQNIDTTIETWDMNGERFAAAFTFNTVPGTSLALRAAADFDGDRMSDVLWQGNDGNWQIWLMQGSVLADRTDPRFPLVTDNGQDTFAGTGDFDGDGKADILWRRGDGNVRVWLMDGRLRGLAPSSARNPPLGPEWSIQGRADFDGDGRSDILWRNQDGRVAIWLMNEATITSETIITQSVLGTDWTIQGTADFDGDGRSDVLWRNQDGTRRTWFMDGAVIVAQGTQTDLGPALRFQALGDFNNDGKADILWRNADDTVAMTLIDSRTGQPVTAFLRDAEAKSFEWSIRGSGRFDGD